MKIFEKDYKINFVDDNNVFVGFDYFKSCCEHFGYVISRKKLTSLQLESIIDSGASNLSLQDEDLNNFNFVTSYQGRVESSKNNVVFKLKNVRGKNIYLTLYNYHNGYYSHGFEMGIGKEFMKAGRL